METKKKLRPEMTQSQQTWHKYTDVPLIVASLAYLIAYTWRAIGDLSGVGWTLTTLTMTTTWLMFLIDYVVRFATAKEKVRWFVTHWVDLLCVMVPVLRLVILLRVFTQLGSRWASPGDRMRVQVMVYGIGSSAILVYISALAVLEAERNAAGATIKTFRDAIWWACVTVSTTGYGDYTPVTSAGRLTATALMFGGMALIGVTTATLASLMIEIASRHEADKGTKAVPQIPHFHLLHNHGACTENEVAGMDEDGSTTVPSPDVQHGAFPDEDAPPTAPSSPPGSPSSPPTSS